MDPTQTFRCASCGAPLTRSNQAAVVDCIYCGSQNRLVTAEVEEAQAKHARFAQAADEARGMDADVSARSEALMAELTPLQEKALVEGDREAGQRATELFEGYMRLQYAPTLHMYKAMEPDDPTVVAALGQIDAAVDQSVAAFAQSVGADYKSTAERLA